MLVTLTSRADHYLFCSSIAVQVGADASATAADTSKVEATIAEEPEAEAAAANEDDAAAAEPTEQPTAAAAAVSDFLPLHPPRPSPYLSLKITMLIHFFISQ